MGQSAQRSTVSGTDNYARSLSNIENGKNALSAVLWSEAQTLYIQKNPQILGTQIYAISDEETVTSGRRSKQRPLQPSHLVSLYLPRKGSQINVSSDEETVPDADRAFGGRITSSSMRSFAVCAYLAS